jgi:rhamnosyltransferase
MKKVFADRLTLGIKAAFCSNSFAAYRLKALRDIGGFKTRLIMGEDMLCAAQLLNHGHAVHYAADALVHHSHNYSGIEEFQRYFDTGVFHCEEREVLQQFGGTSAEGLRLLQSQMKALGELPLDLMTVNVGRLLLSTGLKWLGYRLGLIHQSIPLSIKRHLSMNKTYWSQL